MPLEDSNNSHRDQKNCHVAAQTKQGKKMVISDTIHRASQKIRSMWIGKLINRLSIAKKFGFSYALAIGIPVVGTTAGLALGGYYEKQALQTLVLADEQQQHVTNLEKAVIGMRSHPQQVLPILGKSIWFDLESYKFSANVEQVRDQLLNLANFLETNPNYSAVDTTKFKKLLKSYEVTTNSYSEQLDSLLQEIDPTNLELEEIPAARQKILAFMSGSTTNQIDSEFELLSENLNQIIAAAETQKKQAITTIERVQALRLQIILVTMLLSVAIASILSIYTSHQIASPLKTVTSVARRVTQESNFNLRTPVTTEDEVGSLATSLNQLIQWVGEYTHQLELARQMLKQRVEERTQELTQALQELGQTQSQLIQSEKMSSLGQLVAGVAHEINNPVNFIFGNLQYAREYTEDLLELVQLYQQHYPNSQPEIQERIEAIELEFLSEDLSKLMSSMKLGVDRIRQIVVSLRNFSRLDEAEMKAVDIHEGIESTLLILNNRLKNSVEVIKQYGNLPLIECYAAQLNQLFMNIIANAIDALEESETRDYVPTNNGKRQDNYHKKKHQILIQTENIANKQIRIKICDNGPGVPPEIKNKLFDPFFTTKKVGKGTGLGLSISHQIVEKHHGKIELNSEIGKGTEFVICLPVSSTR
ncbi:ATP-binding protein [Lyngbya aestuarii]|uniref:ATP-binding protein n=1 Tax=Lyngbya aestuarii TaxID=118322 RepID=UPI00403DF4A8